MIGQSVGDQLEEARRRRLRYTLPVLALMIPAFGGMAQAADEDFGEVKGNEPVEEMMEGLEEVLR